MSSSQARIGWGSHLGSLMRLKVTVTPNADGPLTDMTSVLSASLRVERANGTTSTWTLAILGSPTSSSITFVHTYDVTDLVRPEALRCFVLMTTADGIVPSEPFTLTVVS